MRNGLRIRGLFCAVVLMAAAAYNPAFCDATLEFGLVRPQGGCVEVPVQFIPDESAGTAGLQFDLEFDASEFAVDSVAAGYSAIQGDKGVTWSEPAPGQLRVLVAGLNQTTMPPGTVVSVYLVPASAASHSEPCAFAEGVASGPFGEDVALSYTSETVTEATPAKTSEAELNGAAGNDGFDSLERDGEASSARPAQSHLSDVSRDSAGYTAPHATKGAFGISGAPSADGEPASARYGDSDRGPVPSRPRRAPFLFPNRSEKDGPIAHAERGHSVVASARNETSPGVSPLPPRDSIIISESEAHPKDRSVVARVWNPNEDFVRSSGRGNDQVQNDSQRVVATLHRKTWLLHKAAFFAALVFAATIVFLVRRRFLETRGCVRRR